MEERGPKPSLNQGTSSEDFNKNIPVKPPENFPAGPRADLPVEPPKDFVGPPQEPQPAVEAKAELVEGRDFSVWPPKAKPVAEASNDPLVDPVVQAAKRAEEFAKQTLEAAKPAEVIPLKPVEEVSKPAEAVKVDELTVERMKELLNKAESDHGLAMQELRRGQLEDLRKAQRKGMIQGVTATLAGMLVYKGLTYRR
jgi:hypothetical protein